MEYQNAKLQLNTEMLAQSDLFEELSDADLITIVGGVNGVGLLGYGTVSNGPVNGVGLLGYGTVSNGPVNGVGLLGYY